MDHNNGSILISRIYGPHLCFSANHLIGVQRALGIPVKLVGLGETAADLIDFDPNAFVDALFEE